MAGVRCTRLRVKIWSGTSEPSSTERRNWKTRPDEIFGESHGWVGDVLNGEVSSRSVIGHKVLKQLDVFEGPASRLGSEYSSPDLDVSCRAMIHIVLPQ